MTTMQPEVRVRVIDDERLVVGDQEMRLLEAIGRQGTLVEGAAALGLSYRCAWGKIRAVEARLGTKLVESRVGGSGGGRTRPTEDAQRLVSRYGEFRAVLGEYATREVQRCFEYKNGVAS